MSTVSPELLSRFDPHAVELQHGQPPDLRESFQQFAAGTFYTQMLKSLRRTHGRAAYLDGGQAEQMFREQLDQYVADSLAERHGNAFTEPLFRTFSLQYQAAQRNLAPAAETGTIGKTATIGKSLPSSAAASADH